MPSVADFEMPHGHDVSNADEGLLTSRLGLVAELGGIATGNCRRHCRRFISLARESVRDDRRMRERGARARFDVQAKNDVMNDIEVRLSPTQGQQVHETRSGAIARSRAWGAYASHCVAAPVQSQK